MSVFAETRGALRPPLQVELAAAALRRIQLRPVNGGQPRAARVLLAEGSAGSPSPAPVGPISVLSKVQPIPVDTLNHTAQCLSFTTERLTVVQGRCFKGLPHYFGDNKVGSAKIRTVPH